MSCVQLNTDEIVLIHEALSPPYQHSGILTCAPAREPADLLTFLCSFGYQIQRLSDSAKFVVVRVAGADPEPLSMPDEEKTWADYRARVERTISVLEAASAADFVGKENVEIALFGGKFKLNGVSYLQNFAIPNFYFHVVTAYDLLRSKGVPIGKLDYLAGNQGVPGNN